MTSVSQQGPKVIVGVDTHKFTHVAVALNHNGAMLGSTAVKANAAGYAELISWATTHSSQVGFAVEGTGSYGADLSAAIQEHGLAIVEVAMMDRRDRRLRGKSDTLDAENAARAVLAGKAAALPKAADGTVEMIRQVKVAKDVAVKARTAAMVTLKSVLINPPTSLREALQPLTRMALIRRCAALRPGPVTTVEAAAKHALRSTARRWLTLDGEIKEHAAILAELTARIAPGLVDTVGLGPDTAADLLIAAGDNPGRIRSEAAWARLCGVAPIPASSGKINRHRLHRGGHRQANAALYRVVAVRMKCREPTKAYVARRLSEGKTKHEIIRCLKRLLTREVWSLMRPLRQPGAVQELAA